MLQLTATLKAKTAPLERQAWGHLTAAMVESKTSGLWDLLEDPFCKMSEAEEEKSLPSKRSQSEDEPSKCGSGPSVLSSATTIQQPAPTKPTVIFPMNESSLHDSGIKSEYLPVHEKLPHNKVVYLCGFHCGYCAKSRVTISTHICKEHLHIMLECPHCVPPSSDCSMTPFQWWKLVPNHRSRVTSTCSPFAP